LDQLNFFNPYSDTKTGAHRAMGTCLIDKLNGKKADNELRTCLPLSGLTGAGFCKFKRADGALSRRSCEDE
jgi:hypothetical protein